MTKFRFRFHHLRLYYPIQQIEHIGKPLLFCSVIQSESRTTQRTVHPHILRELKPLPCKTDWKSLALPNPLRWPCCQTSRSQDCVTQTMHVFASRPLAYVGLGVPSKSKLWQVTVTMLWLFDLVFQALFFFLVSQSPWNARGLWAETLVTKAGHCALTSRLRSTEAILHFRWSVGQREVFVSAGL